MTMLEKNRNCLGCAIMIVIIVGFICGCVVIAHFRAGADVCAIKDEPPEVVKSVIEHMNPHTPTTNELEIRK